MRPSITSRPRSATSASTAVFLTRQSASPTASMSSGMAFRPARLRSTAASLRSSASPLWSFLREKSILSISRLRHSRAVFMAPGCVYFGQLETLSHVNDRDDGPPQVNDAFYKLGHAGERRDLERPEDLGYGADVKTVFFQTHLKRNDLDRVLDDRNLFLFTHF